jgi:hypothetical protein
MADESGPLEAMGKILPGIYYDLIARVCAGVPFLVALLWERKQEFGGLTWVRLTLLLGAGYVAGLLLLTPLSLPWSLVQLLVRRILKMPLKEWRYGPSLYDQIAAKDKEAGTTLVKMQAEAMLCQNLFTAFTVLLVLNGKNVVSVPLLKDCTTLYGVIILLILAGSCVHRITAYLVREKRLHRIYLGEVRESQDDAIVIADT